MIFTASSFFSPVSVNIARERLCKGTEPDVFKRVAASDVSDSADTWIDSTAMEVVMVEVVVEEMVELFWAGRD